MGICEYFFVKDKKLSCTDGMSTNECKEMGVRKLKIVDLIGFKMKCFHESASELI